MSVLQRQAKCDLPLDAFVRQLLVPLHVCTAAAVLVLTPFFCCALVSSASGAVGRTAQVNLCVFALPACLMYGLRSTTIFTSVQRRIGNILFLGLQCVLLMRKDNFVTSVLFQVSRKIPSRVRCNRALGSKTKLSI